LSCPATHTVAGVAELSNNLQGDSEMLLKR